MTEKGLRNWLETLGRSLLAERSSPKEQERNTSSHRCSDSDTIVRNLYLGLLKREGTDADIAAWSSEIDKGVPLARIVHEFDESPEHLQLLETRQPPPPPALSYRPSLTILDIGAQPLSYEEDPFAALVRGGNCRVIGFEPLETGKSARASADPSWNLVADFAGDGASRTFYETESSPTSSLYEPNHDGIGDFTGLAEVCRVVSTRDVRTVRLDDVIQEPVHFLKLDVQGAELDVLRGAERLLRDVLVIHSEVEFYPIYQGQPLFDSIFRFLRDRGFELFDLPRQTKYSYQPTLEHRERLLWSEAVFIPTRDRIDQLDEDAMQRLVRIMHDNYGAVGFSQWILDRRQKGIQGPAPASA